MFRAYLEYLVQPAVGINLNYAVVDLLFSLHLACDLAIGAPVRLSFGLCVFVFSCVNFGACLIYFYFF